MLQYLEYPFFRQALVAVLLLSVCSAVIGTYIISRRLVAISGGVTHACFGGLGLGYFLGLNPVLMAAVFAIGSSVGVEVLSRRFRLREDSAIAVVWAGWTIWVNFHRWPVLMREPGEQTVCLLLVILFLSPMFVMFPPQKLSKEKCPTV